MRGGFAKSTSYPPDVKYQEVFRTREIEARTAGAGLWGATCAAATPAPTVAPTAARTAAPTSAPTVAATVAPAPALSVTITTSRYGLFAASTLAGASCTAQARLPSGAISTDRHRDPYGDLYARWGHAQQQRSIHGELMQLRRREVVGDRNTTELINRKWAPTQVRSGE